MISPRASSLRAPIELLDQHPRISVLPSEYWRLLGYPNDEAPGERARELVREARSWFEREGRPWLYFREVEINVEDESILVEGVRFCSPKLREHFVEFGVQSAVIAAVSAGAACEREARLRWEEGKPDEYFFLEMYGSAVVEHLVASLNARICSLADRDGLMAIPHYSPGYAGWDVAEQNLLFQRLIAGRPEMFPEPLEVLSSGMLRPKKSLLAIVGLAPRRADAPSAHRVPCETCSYSPCQYRRTPYRHADRAVAQAQSSPSRPMLIRNAKYTVNPKALQKWAQERVRLSLRPDGSCDATFRFDGTTCSNQGRPLAFEYHITVSPAATHHVILDATCKPATGDVGFESMCAYLTDPDGLMKQIAEEKPLLGRPLDEVLQWKRDAAPSGCYCAPESRTHKWGLALEAIHFALTQALVASSGGETSSS
ncbi:MAG TPA: hypothetical protein VFT72_05605 [Opitutaceae bacterium]|nr:hypothetical protein [Opitutaceae bacterium]